MTFGWLTAGARAVSGGLWALCSKKKGGEPRGRWETAGAQCLSTAPTTAVGGGFGKDGAEPLAVDRCALRSSFYGDKQGQDSFGPGVGPALRERLHSEDAAERSEAIRGVVEDFVQRRLERSRLSEVQRASLAQYLRQMRKKGMAILMEYQQDDAPEDYLDLYREWSACPSCDGANAAEYPLVHGR